MKSGNPLDDFFFVKFCKHYLDVKISLLGYESMSTGKELLTFRRRLVQPF